MENMKPELKNMVLLNDEMNLNYKVAVTYWHLYSDKKVVNYNDVLEAHIGNKLHTAEGYEVENIEVTFKVFESKDLIEVTCFLKQFESRLLAK